MLWALGAAGAIAWLVLFRIPTDAPPLQAQRGQAIAAADRALKLMQERNTAIEMKTVVLTLRSEALRGLGDLPGAIEAGREAVDVARRQPCIADGIRAQVTLGLALLDSEEDTASDEAVMCLEGANAWLKESGACGFASHVRELEDRLAR